MCRQNENGCTFSSSRSPGRYGIPVSRDQPSGSGGLGDNGGDLRVLAVVRSNTGTHELHSINLMDWPVCLLIHCPFQSFSSRTCFGNAISPEMSFSRQLWDFDIVPQRYWGRHYTNGNLELTSVSGTEPTNLNTAKFRIPYRTEAVPNQTIPLYNSLQTSDSTSLKPVSHCLQPVSDLWDL